MPSLTHRLMTTSPFVIFLHSLPWLQLRINSLTITKLLLSSNRTDIKESVVYQRAHTLPLALSLNGVALDE